MTFVFNNKKICHFLRLWRRELEGEGNGRRLRAAQQVECEGPQSGFRGAKAENSARSGEQQRAPDLSTRPSDTPSLPHRPPPAPTAFSTLRWAATQVKRTTTVPGTLVSDSSLEHSQETSLFVPFPRLSHLGSHLQGA